jgi:parallel beta-helix repeat protein
MRTYLRFRQVFLLLLGGTILLSPVQPGAADLRNAETLYVANNGTDGPTCGTRAAPCRSISEAIQHANADDLILVGPGRYGDLDADGTVGEIGEERGEVGFGCQCMLHVNKRVTIWSTEGPAATTVDARRFVELSGIVAVRISADGATFGRPTRGFTVTGSQRNEGLSVANATHVTVAGNVSSGNAGGFSVFGSRNVLSHNTAVAIDGPAFGINGHNHTIWKNVAVSSGDAFQVRGNHLLAGNLANGNGRGFLLIEGHVDLYENSAIGNHNTGIYIQPGVTATIRRGNLFGNGGTTVNSDVPRTNCGLFNRSGGQIFVHRVYWGADTGPGADPADDVCDAEGSQTVQSFAERAFRIAKELEQRW